LSNITNAIFESGGVDTSGSLRDIKLKRNGQTIVLFDLYDLFLNGDTSNDSRLMQGDVVFVESIGKTAGVKGEVNRPAIYELKDDENLDHLFRFAGGMKPKANYNNAEIMRINSVKNIFELQSVDLNLAKENVTIMNGDVISIYPINNQIQNAVLLTGHTPQPGFYPINDNMKIADLLGSQNNLLELTDMNYVLIKRKDSATQKYSFLQVDLEQVFSNSETDQNIKLKNQDEILLLPSLLSPDLITTRLIQDKFEIDEETNKLVLENEWRSPTYLRKSLMEETIAINQQNAILQNQFMNSDSANIANIEDGSIRRYYEYTIYDYCAIPQDIAVLVAEQTGFKVEKTVPLEELENLKTTEDFLSLKQAIESERIESQNQSENKKEDITTIITNLCRQQLLKPYLDLVKRDNFAEKMSVINVYGSVHFPGPYPYTNNMFLADAIKAAGGPQSGTYKSEIEVTSLNNTGKKFSTSNTVFSMDQAKTVSLSAMDTVHLKQISSDIKTVELTGEVYFPGVYPISENQTLSQLIRRAGGYTEYASPEAAFFQREALKKAEEERFDKAQDELRRKILLSSQAGGLGQNSLDGNAITQLTALVSMDNNQADVLGRLVIDLYSIMDGTSKDIVLEDGDSINIPKNKQSISVIGEVFVSNSHIFSDDLQISDYINLSGGTTMFADESNIYLIRSDGRILSPSQLNSGFFKSNDLYPGDTIVVPLQVQPFSGIRATTEVTQIIYQMALAAAAVNSF
jgi:protein involved in polysaccharide export with SLBB domain